jgi:hypothetical protein
MGMTQNDGVWRDEEKLPVSELSQAMASWDLDGQGDATGNDAGAEQEFGHDSRVPTDDEPGAEGPDRAARPSTTGRTGPG